MRFGVCALAFSVAHGLALAQLSSLRQLLSEREQSLATLVGAAERAEAERCARLAELVAEPSAACQTPGCGNVFADEAFQCTNAYGRDAYVCGSTCRGLRRALNRSTVLLAPDTRFTSTEVQAFLATGGDMDIAFARSRPNVTSWMGYAHYTGTHRQFPGGPRNRNAAGCEPYDPRQRCWYVAASSGPKDLVLLLDTSASMQRSDCPTCKSRLNLMKQAVCAVLGTLTLTDYFTIITYNSAGAVITGPPHLIQATQSNIERARQAVTELTPDGGTYFLQGLVLAFDAFRNSLVRQRSSLCQRMILLLTDGFATDAAAVPSFLDRAQLTLGARVAAIFTFGMGPAADTTLLRRIACDYGGIWHSIVGGSNPLNEMGGYYKFLANGMDVPTPRWVEPYEDACALRSMATLSCTRRPSPSGKAWIATACGSKRPLLQR